MRERMKQKQVKQEKENSGSSAEGDNRLAPLVKPELEAADTTEGTSSSTLSSATTFQDDDPDNDEGSRGSILIAFHWCTTSS